MPLAEFGQKEGAMKTVEDSKAVENPKILFVDDDPEMRELVTAFFRQKGLAVRSFENAEELLEHPELLQDESVLITDLNLPGLSGLELIKKMKEIEPQVPIILVTADSSLDNAVEAIEAGAYDFVVKPIPFTQLMVSVRRAFHFRNMQEENRDLRVALNVSKGQTDGLVAKSPRFIAAIDLAKRISASTANVLITGESGSGKEVIARLVHNSGPRKDKPFIAINCSAIPENLLESELFGHSKGAFTGASDKKLGLFEEAQGGTLFLDEIGDMSMFLQAKLLRVIQEKMIKRVGENQFREINVRFLAGTHKDLLAEVRKGDFREDLYFRLNVIPIKVPPLRERPEDVVPLAEFFIRKFCRLNGVRVKGLSREAMSYLMQHPWKGNVRELENSIERAVVLSNREVIEYDDFLPQVDGPMFQANEAEGDLRALENGHETNSNGEHPPEMHSGDFANRDPQNMNIGLPTHFVSGAPAANMSPAARAELEFSSMTNESGEVLTLGELGKRYVRWALDRNGGAKEVTAKMLGIDRKTLYRKIQELDS